MTESLRGGGGTQAQNRMWRSKQTIHVNKRNCSRTGRNLQYSNVVSMPHNAQVNFNMKLDMDLQWQEAVSPCVLEFFCQVYHLWACWLDSQELARKIHTPSVPISGPPSKLCHHFQTHTREKKKKVKWPVTRCLCLSTTSGLPYP